MAAAAAVVEAEAARARVVGCWAARPGGSAATDGRARRAGRRPTRCPCTATLSSWVGGWKLMQLGQVHPHEEAGWHPPPGQDTSATKYSLGCDLSQQPASAAASECVGAPCLFDFVSELHVEPQP